MHSHRAKRPSAAAHSSLVYIAGILAGMTTAAPTNRATATEPVLSVSQLTLFLKELVEAAFPSVWVAGEISNFSKPQSGHCYLTLKDDQAQIQGVIWRTAAGRLFRKHSTATIQNTVVGQPGTKMPIVPSARQSAPRLWRS